VNKAVCCKVTILLQQLIEGEGSVILLNGKLYPHAGQITRHIRHQVYSDSITILRLRIFSTYLQKYWLSFFILVVVEQDLLRAKDLIPNHQNGAFTGDVCSYISFYD
jgi:hypothetical protein